MGRDFVMPNRGSSRVPGAKRAHGMGGHSLPAPGIAQPLAGRGLHANGILGKPEGFGEVCPHPGDVRSQLWALGDDNRIDIFLLLKYLRSLIKVSILQDT